MSRLCPTEFVPQLVAQIRKIEKHLNDVQQMGIIR